MAKTVSQGGMLNFLGKSKEVKAPMKWKSSPDHPESQLAYITQDEINMLLDANLYGSLKGKPNEGPSGIISLQGAGTKEGVEKAKQQKKQKKQKKTFKQTIMGGGKGGDPTITKKEFAKTQPAGQHKLATQYKRLIAKYGPKFKDTTQGQMLLNYLKGVSYTKGGGMGAPDSTYGTGVMATDAAEADRQALLQAVRESTPEQAKDILKDTQVDADYYRGKLTSDQYFNYRQQLREANPAAYDAAFPWSSGKGVKHLVSPVTSMVTQGVGDLLKTLGLSSGEKKERPIVPAGEGLDPSLFWNLASDQASGETGAIQEEGILNAGLGVNVPNIDQLVNEAMQNQVTQASAVPTDLLDVSQIPFAQNAFFKPDQSYYYGGGGYELPNLLAQNQKLLSLAGGGMVPGYAGGGMIPGYAGGGITGINTSKPDYSAFGRFILGNLPQGGVGNMARGIV